MKAKYAVLDVETTSGDPCEGRIMEVAVVAYDGEREKIQWDSLVDPRVEIPRFIRRLTGIVPDMLEGAPGFTEVARALATLTQDRIVVAHNARFDMTALEHEFARTGLSFRRSTLCTERLARQLVPGLPHYNLGSLCRYFGITHTASHRAGSDAAATAALFLRLVQEQGEDRVLEYVVPEAHAMRA
jgi:DNA polymerase III subunit epsilon